MTHPILLTVPRQTAARVLAISPRAFQRLEAAGVLAPAIPGKGPSPGLYDLTVVVPAYLRHLARERPEPAKDRRDRSQAELNELRLKHRRGELFDARIALEAWSGMVTAFRAQALALPRSLAEILVHLVPQGPAAVEAKLTEAIRDCLTTLAGWQPPGTEGKPAEKEEVT